VYTDGTTVKSEPLFEEFPGGKAKFDGSYVFSDEFEQHVADFMKQGPHLPNFN
jgi:hypothetical protein